MFWVWRCYGLLWALHCPKDSYCDVTRLCQLLFHRIRANVSETPDNALPTRMHGDYRLSIDRFFVGFSAIRYKCLRNNPTLRDAIVESFTLIKAGNKQSEVHRLRITDTFQLNIWIQTANSLQLFYEPYPGTYVLTSSFGCDTNKRKHELPQM